MTQYLSFIMKRDGAVTVYGWLAIILLCLVTACGSKKPNEAETSQSSAKYGNSASSEPYISDVPDSFTEKMQNLSKMLSRTTLDVVSLEQATIDLIATVPPGMRSDLYKSFRMLLNEAILVVVATRGDATPTIQSFIQAMESKSGLIHVKHQLQELIEDIHRSGSVLFSDVSIILKEPWGPESIGALIRTIRCALVGRHDLCIALFGGQLR